MAKKYIVDELSLSKIGDMLKERLGEEEQNYTFPEDFEQAVEDVDFKAIVFSGDTAPYDVTVVGAVDLPYVCCFNFSGNNTQIKTVSYVGVGNREYIVPQGAFYGCQALTSVTLPANTIKINQDGFNNSSSLTSLTNINNIQIIGGQVLRNVGLSEITLESLQTVVSNTNTWSFASNVNLKTLILPVWNSNGSKMCESCSALQYVQIGSVGHPVQYLANTFFSGCTQTSLTIVCYPGSNYINTILTNIRNGATGATIILKAPVGLTYDGVDYEPGDIFLTSTP